MGNEKAPQSDVDKVNRLLAQLRHLVRIRSLERDEAQDNLAQAAADLDEARDECHKLADLKGDLVADLLIAREFAREVYKSGRGTQRKRAGELFNRCSRRLGVGFSESYDVENGRIIHTIVQEAPDMEVRFTQARAKKGGRR